MTTTTVAPRKTNKASWLGLAILGLLASRNDVRSLSSNDSGSNNAVVSRRRLFSSAAAAAATVVAASDSANAACLQGDTRPVCIGIYKIPMDDAYANYISTPEQLEKFAPDLKYVPPTEYPKTYTIAMQQLEEQRKLSDAIKQKVASGKLEDAGVVLLGMIPTISASGRVVVEELEASIRSKMNTSEDDNYDPRSAQELAIDMANTQFNLLNGYFGECDIVIGQGLRGELGVTAVAQLTILSTLRDATGALDDFLVTAETFHRGNLPKALPPPPAPEDERPLKKFLFF